MSTKVHTRYELKNGTKVPGVTTILGMYDKPALMHWAWECGIRGDDYRKVRDKAASIGTIAHYLIECHLRKQKPDLSEYSQANIDKAETAFIAFLDFEKKNHIETIMNETPMVSEMYKFGGTIDCYCRMDGIPTLLDFKTSSGLYPEMRIQVAAYQQLLFENGHPTEQCHILRIDKESGEFNHHPLSSDLTVEWDFFKRSCAIYPIKSVLFKR